MTVNSNTDVISRDFLRAQEAFFFFYYANHTAGQKRPIVLLKPPLTSHLPQETAEIS